METNTLSLMPLFCDGMVLQKDKEYEIWGRETASDTVTVEIDGVQAVVNTLNGRFRVSLPAHKAGSGYTMTVRGSVEVNIKDICFGDVFLFAGQSNFELPCSRVLDVSAEELAAADYPFIREYKVVPSYRFDRPEEEVLPAVWKKARGAELYDMGAAAFFFAKELYNKCGVPIGIINVSVGGSLIEAWLPNWEIEKLPGRPEKIAPFLVKGSLEEFLTEQERQNSVWRRALKGSLTAVEIPADAGDFAVPGLTANTELDGFSGSVWFYKEAYFEKAPEGEGLLYLGELINSDRAYVNGVKVGATGYRYPPRKYKVPEGLLRAGENLIAVRLIIERGAGGFIPEHPYYLEAGGVMTQLSGLWKYALEISSSELPPNLFAPNLPAGLYNSSLAPLAGIRFKGVLWYQGESDAYEPERYFSYAERLTVLARCWREALGEDLGFIIVEIAGYTDPADGVLPGWAEIQKAQREAPEYIPRCVCVSASDLGAPYELHPQYKKELGLRLAAAAEELFY